MWLKIKWNSASTVLPVLSLKRGIELITRCACGKFTPFNYSCVKGEGGREGRETTQTTVLHFHPLHFQLCWTGKRILRCDSNNCDVSTALKHVAQKERLASYVKGGYVCKSQKKVCGYILKVKLMEALSFFCISYMCGLRLLVGAVAFPEVVTVQQRRRTSIMLVFCHAIILLLCRLLCIFHGGVQRLDHFQMPSTGVAEFPCNDDFADDCKCSNCLQHNCPEDAL